MKDAKGKRIKPRKGAKAMVMTVEYRPRVARDPSKYHRASSKASLRREAY